MDALHVADRAVSTGTESCSMQLCTGPSSNQVLWIGFCYCGKGEKGSPRQRLRDRLQGQDKQGVQVEPKGRHGSDAEPFTDTVLWLDVRSDTERRRYVRSKRKNRLRESAYIVLRALDKMGRHDY